MSVEVEDADMLAVSLLAVPLFVKPGTTIQGPWKCQGSGSLAWWLKNVVSECDSNWMIRILSNLKF